MSYRSGVITGVVATLLLGGAAAAGWWMLAAKPGESAKSAQPIPATVPKPFKEGEATGVTLTAAAEERLAIQLGAVKSERVARVRLYGGEVTVPPGQSVVVSAPLAGVLKSAAAIPAAGTVVKQGSPLFQLLPILDPVGRANLTASKVDAQGQVENAQEQLRAANIALDRAKKVLASGAGSQRMVDEAQAQVDLATKTLEAAAARSKLLNDVVGQVETGATSAVTIDAPTDGVLRSVSALPGQTVAAGAPLFEVVKLDHVWVRTPVYVGDAADVDLSRPAQVGSLTGRPGEPTRTAAPVRTPPTATAAAGTVDLYFALDNRNGSPTAAGAVRDHFYDPGQRVGVTLSLKDPAESLTVLASAVVYDIHGGGWVYEKTGDRHYSRRRVVVRHTSEGRAVLASGPPIGTAVVTAGAAELFGTETGFSK